MTRNADREIINELNALREIINELNALREYQPLNGDSEIHIWGGAGILRASIFQMGTQIKMIKLHLVA